MLKQIGKNIIISISKIKKINPKIKNCISIFKLISELLLNPHSYESLVNKALPVFEKK